MHSNEFSFELVAQNDKARLGKITTPKGIIDTPFLIHFKGIHSTK